MTAVQVQARWLALKRSVNDPDLALTRVQIGTLRSSIQQRREAWMQLVRAIQPGRQPACGYQTELIRRVK